MNNFGPVRFDKDGFRSDFFGKLSARVHLSEAVVDFATSMLEANEKFFTNETFFVSWQEALASSIREIADGHSVEFGPVATDSSAQILAGTVLEGPVMIGPRTRVGPNAYIRGGTVIGADCRIGFGAEIHNSIICDAVICTHRAYLGHSVVGESAMIGAGCIVSARRLDDTPVQIRFADRRIKTQLHKLGAFIGARAKVASHSTLNPGKVLRPDETLFPSST
jgi:NDP-sugar pyrophosphorylase family protein